MDIAGLAPEILLNVFLRLDSEQLVVSKTVCKSWLDVIDNNKSLWRVLDWTQKEEESPIPALEMFDEKSASHLREVSIVQKEGDLDEERLIEVLQQSRESLRSISLKVKQPKLVWDKVVELASELPLLNSLVLWDSSDFWLSFLPRARLRRKSKTLNLSDSAPPSSTLHVLWIQRLTWIDDWIKKAEISFSSIVSFSSPTFASALRWHSFISNFSSTLVHLFISVGVGELAPSSLSCPCLRIMEGRFPHGFPTWLDAPHLRTVIVHSADSSFLQELPASVEELWFLDRRNSYQRAVVWEPLLNVSPILKVLKVGKGAIATVIEEFLLAFRERAMKVQAGVKIDGVKMVKLQKLVIPTNLLNSVHLEVLRTVVKEVVDVKHYPDFIEVDY